MGWKDQHHPQQVMLGCEFFEVWLYWSHQIWSGQCNEKLIPAFPILTILKGKNIVPLSLMCCFSLQNGDITCSADINPLKIGQTSSSVDFKSENFWHINELVRTSQPADTFPWVTDYFIWKLRLSLFIYHLLSLNLLSLLNWFHFFITHILTILLFLLSSASALKSHSCQPWGYYIESRKLNSYHTYAKQMPNLLYYLSGSILNIFINFFKQIFLK